MSWKDQLLDEARAKIFWGESPETVSAYMQSQGLKPDEIRPFMEGVVKEREESVRVAAKRSILVGLLLIPVPIVAFLIFRQLGFFSIKLFAATVVVGLYGGFKVFRGTIHFTSPHLHKGDLSEDPA